jgi:hypothetical protein
MRMRRIVTATCTRRALLAGAAGAGSLALLPGCASTGPAFTMEEAVRRLLLAAADNAFARLTAPGGFWDEQVARIGLEQMLGSRGAVLSRILTSATLKQQLEERFARLAIDASFRAAPVVTEAVRVIGLDNAIALIRGGPDAATAYLRQQMGSALIDAMVPELADAIRLAEDPLVGEVPGALTGARVGEAAQRLARMIDDAIWGEIAREEAAIRANPAASRDPVLIGVFGAARLL